MTEMVYPYDRELYNRLFLNCYQRQSMVALAERVPSVYQLFHRCLVSTDDILDQIIKRQRPKYDFESDFFAPEDLARIGLVAEDVPVDTYAEARSLVLDTVHREGYVVLVIDVFYLPHCPEYRNEHLVHTVTLRDYDAGEWSLVDDNPASVLCWYRYPEEVVAASFDNNQRRRVRYFTTKDFDAQQAHHETAMAFATLLDTHHDSYTLLSEIGDILTCPWIATETAISLLHDAFSIYQGARSCLLEYVRHALGAPDTHAGIGRIVERAGDVRNHLLLGKVTGMVDSGYMASACHELKGAEEEALSLLRRAAEKN
ncbi:hypothetical protein [Salinactinospora qingdaonensis]|uniref:Butirosin biosynthesis protein H, N-terminal n=1 Tax=Salinactinospora qingdaonensis TaxID=702744 RepID=A0ABP7G4N2_9ACTN